MLFLFRLLALPVTGPVRGFQFILEAIRDQALAEMLSEEEIQSLLVEASLRNQAGEISDDEYQEIENALLEQLNMLRSLSSPPDYEYEVYESDYDYEDDVQDGESR